MLAVWFPSLQLWCWNSEIRAFPFAFSHLQQALQCLAGFFEKAVKSESLYRKPVELKLQLSTMSAYTVKGEGKYSQGCMQILLPYLTPHLTFLHLNNISIPDSF